MKTTKGRKLTAAVLLGLAAFGASRLFRSGAGSAVDAAQITGRVWVDSKPVKYTDYVNEFFVSSWSKNAVFAKRSAYELHFERADHRREAQKLSLVFPQTGKTADVTFSVTKCSTLPPFDLCLELSDNPWGGPKRFYAMTDQDDESNALGKEARRLREEAGE